MSCSKLLSRPLTGSSHLKSISVEGLPLGAIFVQRYNIWTNGSKRRPLLSRQRSLQHHDALQARFIIKPPNTHYQPQHEKQGIPEDYELIFHNQSWNYYSRYSPILFIMFCTIYATTSLVLIRYYWYGICPENGRFGDSPIDPLPFLQIFMVSSPVFFYVFWKFFGLFLKHMYYHPKKKEFIAVYQRFGMKDKKLHFTVDDIKYTKPKLLNIGDVQIKGITFAFREEDFVLQRYYNIIMGHDEEVPSLRGDMTINKVDFSPGKMRENWKEMRSKTFEQKYREKRKMTK